MWEAVETMQGWAVRTTELATSFYCDGPGLAQRIARLLNAEDVLLQRKLRVWWNSENWCAEVRRCEHMSGSSPSEAVIKADRWLREQEAKKNPASAEA